MRANARNPQSYVGVIAAQELRVPVEAYIRPVEVFERIETVHYCYRRSAWRFLTTRLLCILTPSAGSSALEPSRAWARSFSQRAPLFHKSL
jgi:hypothetical protein